MLCASIMHSVYIIILYSSSLCFCFSLSLLFHIVSTTFCFSVIFVCAVFVRTIIDFSIPVVLGTFVSYCYSCLLLCSRT